jgi:DNA polymerase-3 subunit epsilon
MIILGIDLEGVNQNLIENGVNLEVDRVIEIGAALWDWEAGQPVSMISEIVNEPKRLKISEELEDLTGISESICQKWGLTENQIIPTLKNLAAMMERADYCMAHNGTNYDHPMLEAMFKRYDLTMPDKVWIDTMVDIEFPNKIKGRSMALLEHAHGFINPFPHRAITDVLAMFKVAGHYDVKRMAKLAESPVVKIVAKLDAPNWRNQGEVEAFNKVKNKVAKARFKWNPSKKTWYKDVHQVLLDEGKINYDFDWFIQQ